MSNYQYDYTVFICRAQPFHFGHKAVIDKALEVSENVIIVLGSHNRPRTIKNPFTTEERKNMIYLSLGDDLKSRIHFIEQEDYFYNDTQWIEDIQKKVHAITWSKWKAGPTKIALIGHKKDSSSYYLNLFPTWESIDVPQVHIWNATDIREDLFGWDRGSHKDILDAENEMIMNWSLALDGAVPNETKNYIISLIDFHCSKFFVLMNEYEMIKQYKKQWDVAPYPPTFITVDATVIQSGHVLLVKRKAAPGKGLWALPGGFLNTNEFIVDGILRELKEETKIDVPEKVLRGNIKLIKVFDHPDRSLRGRTITNNALIRLPDGKLPKIKGSDDAEKAKWVPLGQVNGSEMFEDHIDMLTIMKGY